MTGNFFAGNHLIAQFMSTQGNLRNTYNPARTCHALAPNCEHVQPPTFSDEELGEPKAPTKPSVVQLHHWLWLPEIASMLLCLLLFYATTVPFAYGGLIAVWTWAIAVHFPRYRAAKRKLDAQYYQQRIAYEKAESYYHRVLLPNWQRKQGPIALKQKQYDWRQTAIAAACQRKSWRVHSPAQIAATREQGFIGMGEDDLVRALQNA